MISGREACGAYTKFAAEMANLAMAEGLEKGMAEGRAKERLANARSLMANGISLDIIVKSLELSPEEIEQLTVK